MSVEIGRHVQFALATIVVLLIAKFLVRRIGGGQYAHLADEF